MVSRRVPQHIELSCGVLTESVELQTERVLLDETHLPDSACSAREEQTSEPP
jgi:hypothetical protein